MPAVGTDSGTNYQKLFDLREHRRSPQNSRVGNRPQLFDTESRKTLPLSDTVEATGQ